MSGRRAALHPPQRCMKLEPFVRVDDTRFTDTLADVTARHGQAFRSGRNAVALNEFDYGHVVFRFQDGGRLEEVTQQAAFVEFAGGVAVPFHALAAFLKAHDENVFERAGFVVSPRYGLAFDPSDPQWVTAIAAHCVDTWRAIA
jgi:hypothetical protein